MKSLLLGFSILFFIRDLTAQALPVPRNYQKAYNNHTRSSDGRPGLNYWQNKATYKIDVSFEPASRKISGKETIVYTNSSPDTLDQIWFKLYPNVYQKGSARSFPGRALKMLVMGCTLKAWPLTIKARSTDALSIDGTEMWLPVPGLLPGKQIKFDLSFSYVLNKGSHQRTGMIDDSSAFIAYFFPALPCMMILTVGIKILTWVARNFIMISVISMFT
jgi:hypothetical protein